MKLLFERSVAGRRQTIFPDLDVPEVTYDKALLREDAPRLPWPLPLACALALAPRLWRRAVGPHLDRWRKSRPRQSSADTAA